MPRFLSRRNVLVDRSLYLLLFDSSPINPVSFLKIIEFWMYARDTCAYSYYICININIVTIKDTRKKDANGRYGC